MHRTAFSVTILCVVLLGMPTAGATCIELDDGCSVCCAGPEQCSTSCPAPMRDWRPERRGRMELAVSGVGALSGDDRSVGGGARVSVGYHRLTRFSDRNIDDVSRPRGVWCAPLLCGGIGLIVMPLAAVVGNERGLELGIERVWIEGVAETRLSAKPVFRVARESRFRTASFVGALAPEIGASLRDGAPDQLFFRWSPYPVDYRLTRWLAVTLEPIAIGVGIGGGVRGWLSSSLGLRVVR